MSRVPLVVLDDDPTGTQTMAEVPVVLRLDATTMRVAGEGDPPAVHLLTNSRALDAAAATQIVGDAASAALSVWPEAELVLRGDSTLRAHVWEEYSAVRAVRFPGTAPVLLLAPALPDAGRITVGGVHHLDRDGTLVPLHDTEYARDPAFAYDDAHLLRWAEQRSEGRFAATSGAEIGLDRLRQDGAAIVAQRLADLAASGSPAVCVVDAVDAADLGSIVEGFRHARAADVPVILRCAPAAAGIASGATATGMAALPPAHRGVLVVVGSYVPTSTRQLAALTAVRPEALVEADVEALAALHPARAIDRLVDEVDDRLAGHGVAVLATTRPGRTGPGGLDRQGRVASALAKVAGRSRVAPDVVITKGGVTSAVTVREGLGATLAWVLGPVATGVARWELDLDGRRISCLVVPGNVGSDRLLVDLVDDLLGPANDAERS